MKKIWIVYLLLIACFALYVLDFRAQQSRMNEQWRTGGLRGEIGEKYVMVTFQMGIDYWKSGLKGFEDAAQALNVSVEYRGSTQRDVHEQITVLEQVIAKKPAGIAISAIHPSLLTATINKAVDAGIPVVLFDSDAPGSKAYSFLGTDNYAAGVEAARKMAELTGAKGKSPSSPRRISKIIRSARTGSPIRLPRNFPGFGSSTSKTEKAISRFPAGRGGNFAGASRCRRHFCHGGEWRHRRGRSGAGGRRRV